MAKTLKSNCCPAALEVMVPGGMWGPPTNQKTKSAATASTSQMPIIHRK